MPKSSRKLISCNELAPPEVTSANTGLQTFCSSARVHLVRKQFYLFVKKLQKWKIF